ncbi:GNAT family N-acetyltransferase [Nocardia sp. NPDC056100]|uniref:GNAT family N-acetyltransferase n=1 Tax=Nocardia sp. NPDC056100 TaxID=3345712 RepID=UPI0035E00BE3
MTRYIVEVTSDPKQFKETAFEFLMRDPVRHTLILSIVQDRAAGLVVDPAPSFFAVVRADAQIVGAMMRTPGRRIVLGQMPFAAIELAAATLAPLTPDAPGVYGDPEAAAEFARAWAALRGNDFRATVGFHLYLLGTLQPAYAPGQPRQGTADDLDLCLRWTQEFATETAEPPMAATDVAARIRAGRWWLWEDNDNPVCLAGHSATLFGITRIGPVYTPPSARRHGYASALTSHLSDRIRTEGSRPCLTADMANPTSNKIYRALGYELVGDYLNYDFTQRDEVPRALR